MAEVELAIGGMTCASCAARVEKKLNRMAGVVATVNYATEKARVTFADGVTPDDLVATVARTGYTAQLPQQDTAPSDDTDTDTRQHRQHCRAARPRGRLAAPTDARDRRPHRPGASPVDGAGPPARQLAVARTDPGHTGRDLGRLAVPPAALTALRHGGSTMDTLVSLGITAAFGWSLYALFLGGDGDEIYLEVATGVTLFLLIGPLSRGPGPARVRCRDARTAVVGREGRGRPARRHGGTRAGHRAAGG
jgi:Cu+-exporting ATPase